MYQLQYTTRFKKDLKKIKRNTKHFNDAVSFIKILAFEGVDGIPEKMNPHRLKGYKKDNWECHIKPDLLIIWIQIELPHIIKLVRIGSHSDLFK